MRKVSDGATNSPTRDNLHTDLKQEVTPEVPISSVNTSKKRPLSDSDPKNPLERSDTSFELNKTFEQTANLSTSTKLNISTSAVDTEKLTPRVKRIKQEMVAERTNSLLMAVPAGLSNEYMFPSIGFRSTKKRVSKRKRNKTAKDKQWWTKEEDDKLRRSVATYGAKNWKQISDMADIDKTDVQCLQRWSQVLRPGLKKGTWAKEEDKRLTHLVEKILKNESPDFSIPWKKIERDMGGRTAKQCRERWKLSLDPRINKTLWTKEEDIMLVKLQTEYGNSWSKIKDILGTYRTENAVKLRFKCLKKREEKFRENINQFEKMSGAPKMHQYPPQVDSTLLQGRKRLKQELNLKKEESHFLSKRPDFPEPSSYRQMQGLQERDIYSNSLFIPVGREISACPPPESSEFGGFGGIDASFDSIMEVADSTAENIRHGRRNAYLDHIGERPFKRHGSSDYSNVPMNYQIPITRENSTKSHDFGEIAKILSDSGL